MRTQGCFLLFLFSLLLACQTRSAAGSVPRFMPMKVVDDVHSYGPEVRHDGLPDDGRKPANLSKPDQFQLLVGRCFDHIDDRYVWSLCPFGNMTQTAVPGSSHPFEGIIGYWREWIIENFTFVGVKFDDGDICGDGSPRNAKVLLSCGNSGQLVHVEESQPCSYTANFTTRLACGDGAMSVRNALKPNQLAQLQELERQKHLYTRHGWERKLREFYVSVGFLLPRSLRSSGIVAEEKDDVILSKHGVTHRFVNGTYVPNFETVAECQLTLAALQIFQLKPLRERLRQLEAKTDG